MNEVIEKMARAVDPEAWAVSDAYAESRDLDWVAVQDLAQSNQRIQASIARTIAALRALRDGVTEEMVGATIKKQAEVMYSAQSPIPNVSFVRMGITAAIDSILPKESGETQ